MMQRENQTEQFDEDKALVFRVIGSSTIAIGLLLAVVVYGGMLHGRRRNKAFTRAPYKLIFSLGLNDTLLSIGWLISIPTLMKEETRGWYSTIIWSIKYALWLNFDAHLIAIGINRFVYTVLPQYRDVLFARGNRIYLWVIGCWCCPLLNLTLDMFTATISGMRWYPYLCTMYWDPRLPGFEFWRIFNTILNCSVALSVLTMYVGIGLKVFIAAKAVNPAMRVGARTIRLNIQQGLVFVVYLIPVILWNFSGFLLYEEHIDTCSLNYFTTYSVLLNCVINPCIYLVFNKDLHKAIQEVFKAK